MARLNSEDRVSPEGFGRQLSPLVGFTRHDLTASPFGRPVVPMGGPMSVAMGGPMSVAKGGLKGGL